MKLQQFKKQVLLETGIISAIIVVLGGIIYLLGTIRDDYIDSNDAAQKRVDSIDADMNAVKGKYSNILQNATLYQEVQRKDSQGQLTINRQVVLEKFNQYKSQYSLNNLRLSVSPIQEIKDPQFKRKTSTANFSEVNVELDVLLDQNVYDLMKAMQQELPGVTKIAKLNMTRDRPLKEDVLNAIRQKGTFPLVKTSIKFIWCSINPVDTSNAITDATKSQPAKP